MVEQPGVAATAADVVAQLASAPAFPEALHITGGARRLVVALRRADRATAAAITDAITAAAQAHAAAYAALAVAGAFSSMPPLQRHEPGRSADVPPWRRPQRSTPWRG